MQLESSCHFRAVWMRRDVLPQTATSDLSVRSFELWFHIVAGQICLALIDLQKLNFGKYCTNDSIGIKLEQQIAICRFRCNAITNKTSPTSIDNYVDINV